MSKDRSLKSKDRSLGERLDDELGSRWMRLPLDRDYTPVHVGDMVLVPFDQVPRRVMFVGDGKVFTEGAGSVVAYNVVVVEQPTNDGQE